MPGPIVVPRAPHIEQMENSKTSRKEYSLYFSINKFYFDKWQVYFLAGKVTHEF
jgi:hypothetical protein